MLDLILKGATLVTPEKNIQADIAIKDETIVALGDANSFGEAKRVIELEGKYIMPGVIEPHMHVQAPFMGCTGTLDFFTASQAAAFGGVTTFIDFTNTQKGKSVLECIKMREEEMKESAIDFGIHAKFVEATQAIIDEIPAIVDYGCPSFKLFMTYKKEGVMIEDEGMLKVFEAARQYGALPGVHAESNAIAEHNIKKMQQKGDIGWQQFAEAKPNLCEKEAVDRAINFASYASSKLYFFHLSTQEGLESVKAAQAKGLPIIAETCPHYLELTKEVYKEEDGYLYIMSPPLRGKRDQEALWEGLRDGTLANIGSDNCTYSKEEKEMFLQQDALGQKIADFTKVVNGVSGLEERLPLLLDACFNKEKISLNKVCEITSYNPSKVFGLYPQKGVLAIGSDADLVVIHPKRVQSLALEHLHYPGAYTLYGHREVTGYPIMTLARGKIIVEDGKFLGQRGAGRFIRRRIED